MDDSPLSQMLDELEGALAEAGDPHCLQRVRDARRGSEQQLQEFLVSNSLWGGAGSIADQGGISAGRSERTRRVEEALIRLGEWLLRHGRENVRTRMWVDAFVVWRREGL